jgi:hypothetical protein
VELISSSFIRSLSFPLVSICAVAADRSRISAAEAALQFIVPSPFDSREPPLSIFDKHGEMERLRPLKAHRQPH